MILAIRPDGRLRRAARQNLFLSLPGGTAITEPCVRFFAKNARAQYQHSRNVNPCVSAVFIFTQQEAMHIEQKCNSPARERERIQ